MFPNQFARSFAADDSFTTTRDNVVMGMTTRHAYAQCDDLASADAAARELRAMKLRRKKFDARD